MELVARGDIQMEAQESLNRTVIPICLEYSEFSRSLAIALVNSGLKWEVMPHYFYMPR